MKPKKCKGCGSPFTPARPLQVACGVLCGLDIARAKREKTAAQQKKAERAQDKVKLRGLETYSEAMKRCQSAFNLYVRRRDAGKPCAACGLPVEGGGHASHYLSVGSHPNLRLTESNCHVCCVKCNVFLHGNLLPYRVNLIERVGLEEVLRLESDNGTRKYTREEIEAMTADFRERARALERSAR